MDEMGVNNWSKPLTQNKRENNSGNKIGHIISGHDGSLALGQAFNLGYCIGCNIMKNPDNIHSDMMHSVSSSAIITTCIRNPATDKIERMLSLYIEQRQGRKHM